jgi:hypothetical protein
MLNGFTPSADAAQLLTATGTPTAFTALTGPNLIVTDTNADGFLIQAIGGSIQIWTNKGTVSGAGFILQQYSFAFLTRSEVLASGFIAGVGGSQTFVLAGGYLPPFPKNI